MVMWLNGWNNFFTNISLTENKKYLRLNDISAYNRAYELSNYVWSIIVKWDYFPQSTIGKQFTRSVDSISANIAEGFGRYTKKDKIRFYIISRGSVLESNDWNQKAQDRRLLSDQEYEFIKNQLNRLPLDINTLIKYTNEKLSI